MVPFNQQLTTAMTVEILSHSDSFLMVSLDGIKNVLH
jgi:hypothetical protein